MHSSNVLHLPVLSISLLILVVLPSSISFYPPACPNDPNIGPNCSTVGTTCDQLQPCANDGTCINANLTVQGYVCVCMTGFNGTYCELDYRPCKSSTCWNNGRFSEQRRREREFSLANPVGACSLWNEAFLCACTSGWRNDHCQTRINYCLNVTCENQGVCRTLLGNYTCECLGSSFSGRHCEITSTDTKIRQVVAKTFAYVAIISIVTVMIFVITLDVMKYCFGMDVTYAELRRVQLKKIKRKPAPRIRVRFLYVDHTEQPEA
jgi:hypothetical protein